MSNFLQRTITAFFFAITLIVGVYYSGNSISILFFIISVLSLLEFFRLVGSTINKPIAGYGLLAGIVVYSLFALYNFRLIPSFCFYLVYPIIMGMFLVELFRRSETPFVNVGYTALGIIYAVLPYAVFMSMGFLKGSYTYQIPLGFLLLLWSNDSFAYLFGRALGRTKLFERISPKKTWEGFIGGMICTLLISQGIAYYFSSLSSLNWLIIAAIIVVFGTLGDLVESMLKRSLNVKDSGNLLPGHGGILDRFDGLLLAAPFVYVYLLVIS
ncbi:phosphatidate cytidylyltransferase [Solitalea koreensis]|uniref:Phosphatidate cytidylyltransferase n=1 Tax=Solitalea koreensis TaxID=543615 RepID=A0A521C1D3_9SPHI|nr:phosphatidate cytidylyltransferase [Solitalea koreensis]SMO53194.1 phosphatidate cytidylyltransferase [Solitalea koreensis]